MTDKMRESAVASHIILDAAQHNESLWRNNSGGFYDETGRFVRYGLGSFIPKQECKSSDYIGIKPTLITPEMVGQTIGVFAAVETKPEGWKFNNNDKHCLAQKKFHDMVRAAGGLAGFASNLAEFRKIMNREH